MLQITPKHKVFLAVQAIDFRRGIDGIVALCQQRLQQDPMTGHFFIFRNRKASAIKILVYDGQGYWLCHKRLSTGAFTGWPQSPYSLLTLNAAQLQVLLYKGDPASVQSASAFRHIDGE
jgi:transposase